MVALAETTSPAALARPTLIVGLGQTGLSVARFLAARGERFIVADSRANPPGLDLLQREMPAAAHHLGAFDPAVFRGAGQIVLSPGVSPAEPAVAAARAAGVAVLGDIELFARHARAPVIAITGSNGKSTVTTLVGAMAEAAGLKVAVGGNLGTPALDLLAEPAPELFVLELSSFQLETTFSLNAAAAVVLNVSDDHLDRHADLAEYTAIKGRVYRGAGVMVINADDPAVAAMGDVTRRVIPFTLAEPEGDEFGVLRHDGAQWLAHGREALLPTAALRLIGRQNIANALAALALGQAVGLPRAAMLTALRAFGGLPHRCQFIREVQGVRFYNDSKGTNVGATLAALQGVPGEKVVLIAGGEGKGADFSPLRPALAGRARALVLIGRDAPLIERAVGAAVAAIHAPNMEEAVRRAARAALPGDSVLLSPACASFDMFANYAARGEAFAAAVRGLQP